MKRMSRRKSQFRVSRVAKLQLLERTRERSQDFATLKVANPFLDFRAQSLEERNVESEA